MPPEDVCGISRNFSRLSPCEGQVAYALLTRAPVADRSVATPSLPLDLHVLSLSLAFILSQDQTLRCLNCFIILAPESVIVVQSHTSLTVSIRKINFPILVLLVELCKSLKELFYRFRFANVDAKISVFLLNFQIISELFSRKICFIISISPFSLECGCKSNAIKHNLQTFSALFFKFFLMAQQSLLLMYAHDKGTYIYLY